MRAAALGIAFALVIALALPLLAQSQPAPQPLAYVEVAETDARLVSAYGLNASEVSNLATMAYQAYEQGNYTGAVELSLEAMRLASQLLSYSSRHPVVTGVTYLLGLLTAELEAASSSGWLGRNASTAAYYAEEGLRLLAEGNESGAAYYALEALYVMSASAGSANGNGLSLGLNLLASAEGEARSYVGGNLSLKLGSLSNATVVSLDVNSVLDAVQLLYNGTPAGLVTALRAVYELEALAANLSPSYNMSYRMEVTNYVLNLTREAARYAGLAYSLLGTLNVTVSQAGEDLGNASLSMGCASDSLAYYSVLNLTQAYREALCASTYAGELPNATISPSLTQALASLYSALVGLVNASYMLPSAASVPEAYYNLSYAFSLLGSAVGYVSQAAQRISLGANATQYLEMAGRLASTATSIAVEVNSSPSRPFTNLTSLAVYNASLLAEQLGQALRSALPGLLLLISVARPVNVTAQELVLNLTSEALMNASEAILYYSQSLDQQALGALSASEACAGKAELLAEALNSTGQISYAMADLIYALSNYVSSLDQLIESVINEYPTPPSSYVHDMVLAGEGVANASLSIRYDSLEDASLHAGNVTAFMTYVGLSNETLWDSLNISSYLRQLLSRSPLVEESAMQALSDVAAITSWTSASGLASLAAAGLSAYLEYKANLSAAWAYLSAALEYEGQLAVEVNMTGQQPNAPSNFNRSVVNGTLGLRAALGLGGSLISSLTDANESLQAMFVEASLTSHALTLLTRASYLLSASLYYASRGLWEEANSTLLEAVSNVSALENVGNATGAAAYIVSLAPRLGLVANSTQYAESSAMGLAQSLARTRETGAALLRALSNISSALASEREAAYLLAWGWPSNATSSLSAAEELVNEAARELAVANATGGLWPAHQAINASQLSCAYALSAERSLAWEVVGLSVQQVSLNGSRVIAVGRGFVLLVVTVEGDELIGLLEGNTSLNYAYVVQERGPLLVLSSS